MAYRFIASALLLGGLASLAPADVIQLTNGTTIEGTVKKSGDGYIVIGAGGKTTNLRLDEVESISISPSTKPAAMMERLASLRRAMDNVSDISVILDRYQKFIDQAPDEASRKAASEDVAIWKQRQEQGLIKFGSRWILPADRAKIQEQALSLASQARELMKQGRLKEADPILNQAIAADPGCASAYYLRGLLLFRQDQLPAARKAFEAAASLVPDHAPTLNNLAIVIYRQNQIPGALNQYDRAMIVSPQDKWVLTNVAEALEAVPPEMKKNDIVRKVQRRFDEQIVPLEAKLAATGWYRWGATWVNAADLEKLKAIEAANKAKLDALSVEFDSVQADIKRIEQSIADNQSTLRRIEAESVRYDANGQPIRVAYPPVYYEIVRDNQKLTAERATDITKLEQLRVQAKAIQAKLPTPRYTGVQQIIGVEGAPTAAIVANPTTQPTTQPAH